MLYKYLTFFEKLPQDEIFFKSIFSIDSYKKFNDKFNDIISKFLMLKLAEIQSLNVEKSKFPVL